MKLCRFGPRGHEKPGAIDSSGALRDLCGVVPDITPATVAALKGLELAGLPRVEGKPRYGVPVKGIGKIIAVGLNFRDHAIESGLPIPTEPVVFMKAVSSLTGPDDDVILPRGSTHTDWEVELGLVIGNTCRYVDEADALARVAGYVLCNDVSERFNQKQRGTQWSKGKSHDTFCPTGPWLVTPDEVGDPQNLEMSLAVNGQRMQAGNTKTMIFPVKQVIAYLSQYVTLFPGDLVITGTPPGVGEGRKPTPTYLKAGDQMTLSITGLGTQSQRVTSWKHLGDEVLA